MPVSSKLNIKVRQDLKRLLLSKGSVDENDLRSIGIDTSQRSQEYGNIRITRDFWNGLTVDVIDNSCDVDGLPIAANKKLVARVKNLMENGTSKIKIAELAEYQIWKPGKEITIGNIRLKNFSDLIFSYDHYSIQLIDDKKNIDGLWIDNAITTDRILDVLKHYELPLKRFSKMKELDLNKELEQYLKQHFQTVKKGGRSNQGDIDLILGANHNYGIEIKLAREIGKAAQSQKAIGQIELYTRQFKGNFMLIVAGTTAEKNDRAVAEVVRKAKECKSTYYYLEVH